MTPDRILFFLFSSLVIFSFSFSGGFPPQSINLQQEFNMTGKDFGTASDKSKPDTVGIEYFKDTGVFVTGRVRALDAYKNKQDENKHSLVLDVAGHKEPLQVSLAAAPPAGKYLMGALVSVRVVYQRYKGGAFLREAD